MKKIILSLFCLYIASNFANAQVCNPTTTFNGTATNTFTISDPNGNVGGTMSVSNGVSFQNGSGTTGVVGDRECRAYKSIPTLNNSIFTAECTVSLTAGNNPSHAAMAFSAGTLDFAYTASSCPDQTTQNPCSYASSNQSSIVVYLYNPSAPSISDIITNGTAIVVYTKVGNADHAMASGIIPIPSSAIGNFKIRFERINLTQGRLSYVNVSTNAVIASTCVTIPSTIINLNTLQTGVQTSSSNQRTLTGNVNNYNIYNGCNVTTLSSPTTNPVSIQCGNTTTLTASTITTSPTFSWYNVASGGTAIGTGASITTPLLYANQTYYVSYTDACGQVSPRTSVLVTVNPSISVQPITGSSTLCKNQIIALECTTPGGTWSSSDITKATVKQSGVVTGVSIGTVTISYTVANGSCPGIATKIITIDDVVTFSILGPSPVCPNTSGNSYTVSTPVANADYTWNIQNGPNVGVNFPVNGSTNTTLTIPDAVANNQFTLRCQGLNACGASQMITKLITVNTNVPPTPDVSCSGTNGTNTCVNLVASNSSGNSVQWIVGGIVQSTSTSFVRPLGTSVLCTYTNTISGCKKSTWYSPAVVCTYSLRTSNNEISDDVLKVYPNPNNGNFTFVTRAYVGKVQIVNILGQIIEEISVAENVFTYEVSMTDKPKGTYLVRLTGGNENHVSVIVIQ
jgi:hypothetical protein